jgi:hypothetical protein
MLILKGLTLISGADVTVFVPVVCASAIAGILSEKVAASRMVDIVVFIAFLI